jgi:hypothetical protein
MRPSREYWKGEKNGSPQPGHLVDNGAKGHTSLKFGRRVFPGTGGGGNAKGAQFLKLREHTAQKLHPFDSVTHAAEFLCVWLYVPYHDLLVSPWIPAAYSLASPQRSPPWTYQCILL